MTSHPHFARYCTARWPSPPTPTTATRSVGRTPYCRMGVNTVAPGAHQRSGVLGLDLVRQRKGELPVVDPHVGGEPALVAADDRQPDVRAEVLESALAPLALHARAAHRPDPDPLADAEPIDLGPDSRDDADRLVPGHQRVLSEAEVVVDHGRVGVADPAVGHPDIDLLGTDRPRVVLERLQRALRGQRGVSAHLHRRTSRDLSVNAANERGVARRSARCLRRSRIPCR